MPGKKQEFSEMVNFNAAPGTRALGAVAAKRAGYANLSEFLRETIYKLIEEKITTEAERKVILELLTGSGTTAEPEDDSTEQGGPPANYTLGFREPREVRPAGTPRRLMHLHPDEKTGTG